MKYRKPSLPCLTEAECFSFLRDVESEKITLTPIGEPQEIYAGPVVYQASNGWKIAVFNDANEFDYIEYIRSDDGRESDPLFDINPPCYDPSPEVAWEHYRIPGYMKFRCNRCGSELHREPPYRPPFLCSQCQGQ